MSTGIEKGKIFLRFLKLKGINSWIVGGSVRDHLLGYEPRDIDIVVDTSPHAMYKLFPDMKPRGREGRMSYYVSWRGSFFELVLLEGESLESDLKRRDFTINSMAMDSQGRILDLFGGRNDLTSHVLKFTGVPESRITEDPSRLLRFCRFASFSKMNFHDPSSRYVRENSLLLNGVAAERSGSEILKVIEDEQYSVSSFLVCLQKHNLLNCIMPLSVNDEEAEITLTSVRYLECMKADPFELAAAFLFFNENFEVIKKWGWPKKYKRKIPLIVKWCKAVSGNSLKEKKLIEGAVELGVDGLDSVHLLLKSRNSPDGIPERMQHSLNRMYHFAENIKTSAELPGGDEIIGRLGIHEGVLVKEIKFLFLQEAAMGRIKTREDIERVFERIVKKQ